MFKAQVHFEVSQPGLSDYMIKRCRRNRTAVSPCCILIGVVVRKPCGALHVVVRQSVRVATTI